MLFNFSMQEEEKLIDTIVGIKSSNPLKPCLLLRLNLCLKVHTTPLPLLRGLFFTQGYFILAKQ